MVKPASTRSSSDDYRQNPGRHYAVFVPSQRPKQSATPAYSNHCNSRAEALISRRRCPRLFCSLSSDNSTCNALASRSSILSRFRSMSFPFARATSAACRSSSAGIQVPDRSTSIAVACCLGSGFGSGSLVLCALLRCCLVGRSFRMRTASFWASDARESLSESRSGSTGRDTSRNRILRSYRQGWHSHERIAARSCPVSGFFWLQARKAPRLRQFFGVGRSGASKSTKGPGSCPLDESLSGAALSWLEQQFESPFIFGD